MLKSVVFDNEITIYWEYNEKIRDNFEYIVYLNGSVLGKTAKTHFEIYSLIPNTEYKIKVCLVSSTENIIIGKIVVKTKKTKNKIDITSSLYKAIGDGITLNTKAIQKALDDCTKEDYIYIPKGVFLTGALNIKSDTEIYIEDGGIIQGTDNPNDYLPKIKSRFEGYEMMCYASLLNIGTLDRDQITCENVIIRGKGKVVGGGRKLADNIIHKEKVELKNHMDSLGDKIKEYENIDTIPGRARGRLVNISSSKNVVLSGIEFFDGPAWNIHMIYSENIITQHCSIGAYKVHNGDGWDPDSSHDCIIFDCDFNTSDDCIAIKSGKNPEGNIINKPSFNINIFDIRITCGYGVSIGSEMSGGVKDVNIWNVYSEFVGVTMKAAEKRGGYIKNISVLDSMLGSITLTATVGYNNDGEGAKTYSDLRDFYFKDITLTGNHLRIFKEPDKGVEQYHDTPISIKGLGKDNTYINNVKIENCRIVSTCEKSNIVCENVKNLNIINLENC